MSKYAVVKIGSSQEKVSVGDVLTVPANFKIESKTPILMSARKGSLITDEKKLSKYSVNFGTDTNVHLVSLSNDEIIHNDLNNIEKIIL